MGGLDAKSARDLEEARAFLRQTAMAGGSIVSSASMTPRQIAIARAADRMLVMPDGYGFVYVPGPRFCACGRPESDCDQSREQTAQHARQLATELTTTARQPSIPPLSNEAARNEATRGFRKAREILKGVKR